MTTKQVAERAGTTRRSIVRWMLLPDFPKPTTTQLAEGYKWHYWNWLAVKEWLVKHHKWDPVTESTLIETGKRGRPRGWADGDR